MVTKKQQQKIDTFFSKSDWSIDAKTPKYINDYFNKNMGVDKPVGPDLTPIFHGGALIGTQQDLIDGKIDPTDRSYRM